MFSGEPKFSEKIEKIDNIKSFLKSLSLEDVIVSPEDNIENSYRLIFSFEDDFTVTMKINFGGPDKKDLLITNMTTFPSTDKGFGSKALNLLLDKAKVLFPKIIAVKVDNPKAESFWDKNGFVKCAGVNLGNDFEFKLS